MSYTIADRAVGKNERPYVIAEVGINARTDIELAKAFIDAAAQAGADAVKFQTHMPDEEMVRSEMERIGVTEVYEAVSEASLSEPDHRELQAHSESVGTTFLSTPFSAAAVDLLADIGVPAIKIGSGELTNREILERAAAVNVPLIISVGMSERFEVVNAVEFLREQGADFALLYCVSAYPAEPELFDLTRIQTMRKKFDAPVGLSDHSAGVGVAPLAMGHGAAIVEKHFTLDRRLPGPDQELSIEPDELAELVTFAERAEATRADNDATVHSEEEEIREWAGHSIVTAKPVSAGERFDESNLTTKRPATGIPAERFFDVIGETAAQNIDSGSPLTEDDVRWS